LSRSPRGCALGRRAVLVERVLQLLAGFALGRAAGGNLNRLTGFGVAAGARAARGNREGPNSGNFDTATLPVRRSLRVSGMLCFTAAQQTESERDSGSIASHARPTTILNGFDVEIPVQVPTLQPTVVD
jgi:hypothetical protein